MTYMPPQLTSSPEILRLAQRTLPVLLGLALVGIAPACTLVGVEPDEIDLITGETGNDSLTTGSASGTDSAGEEGTDSNTGDGDGDGDATGDGDGDFTGPDSDTDPGTDSDSDTDTSGDTDTTDTGTETGNDTEGVAGNCSEFVEGELVDGPNALALTLSESWEDICAINGLLGVYAYVPSADGTLSVTPSGFPGGVAVSAYGPECAEELRLGLACNEALSVPVAAGETIYVLVQAEGDAPVMGNLDLTIN